MGRRQLVKHRDQKPGLRNNSNGYSGSIKGGAYLSEELQMSQEGVSKWNVLKSLELCFVIGSSGDNFNSNSSTSFNRSVIFKFKTEKQHDISLKMS